MSQTSLEPSLRLLVVDDDDLILQSVKMAAPKPWHATGIHNLDEMDTSTIYHAALVDIHLSGNMAKTEGFDVISQLWQKYPHMEIVAISGNLQRDTMEGGLRAGASRFLAKPLNTTELELTLEKIEHLHLLQQAGTRRGLSAQWIGTGEASQKVKTEIAQLKGESNCVLIEGESGTGKEVVAQLLSDTDRPFVAVNVAAIPENLFESELFGHVKGAFSGAVNNKVGLASAAHGGDLFLDEIEALAPNLQAKLLRFLESGEIRRVGDDRTSQVNVRVIAATNRNLSQMVEDGEFREDLLWRLNGSKITLPSLRQRKEDLQELSEFFLGQDAARKKTIEPDALQILTNYDWPGNVRELKRVCESLIISAPLPIIRAEDLEPLIHRGFQPGPNGKSTFPVDNWENSLSDQVAAYETSVIEACLKKYQDIDKVGQVLQVSRSSLYKKIKDYNIDWRK